MLRGLHLVVLAILFVVSYAGYAPSVTVVNNVNPCSGWSYTTIKLFYLGGGQQLVNNGGSIQVQSGQVDPNNGLGIQENGEYCRVGPDPSGCLNPDNAGMQMVFNSQSCTDIQLNGPFYCGDNAPNAKNIVGVEMSGPWPNCKAVLTRLGNAPGCQKTC